MKVKFIGEGHGQMGSQMDNETDGRFFAKFEPGDAVPAPPHIVEEIKANEDAWRDRGFILVED